MQTVIRRLDHIFPWELDLYLARGWYRMGQGIYTCSLLWGDLGQTPVIWLRLPLEGMVFSKRQRRLMRKNKERFRIEIRPFTFYEEQEALFAVYKASFDGVLAESFKHQVNSGSDLNVFDSMEVAVYDGDRLVAFSMFDLGWMSVTSISGVYHPDYAAYSLGYCTMLLEMEYALAHDKLFYYPGYVVPGISKFDYKLRIGKRVEGFLPAEERWIPYERFPHEALLPNLIIKQLCLLREELVSLGFQARLLPRFRHTFSGPCGLFIDSIEYMHTFFWMPWLLVVGSSQSENEFFVLSYYLTKNCFYVQRVGSSNGRLKDWSISEKIITWAIWNESEQLEREGEQPEPLEFRSPKNLVAFLQKSLLPRI